MYPSSVIVYRGLRSLSRARGLMKKNFDIWKIRQGGNLLARKSYVRNNLKESKIDCLTYFISEDSLS